MKAGLGATPSTARALDDRPRHEAVSPVMSEQLAPPESRFGSRFSPVGHQDKSDAVAVHRKAADQVSRSRNSTASAQLSASGAAPAAAVGDSGQSHRAKLPVQAGTRSREATIVQLARLIDHFDGSGRREVPCWPQPQRTSLLEPPGISGN